jgi:hypothetical protein
MTHTHHDISFVVGLLARYMQTPHESHWKEPKRVLQCVWGTIQFKRTHLLIGSTNSDSVGGPGDQKSTTGYVFNLGYGLVTWACKKQQAISLS